MDYPRSCYRFCRFSTASIHTISALFLTLVLSSSAYLCLSVFCRHVHPCRTSRFFSVAPLYVLLSSPPYAIIYPSPQHLFLPLIRATSAIFYPYTPTYSLALYITHIYFYLYIYLYIYILLLVFSILYLSLTLCLSIFLYSSSTS